MIVPFVSEGLFDINPNITIAGDENVIVIDNWYLNYESLYHILLNMPVPRWKWEEGSRNFIDYFDCRPLFSTGNYDDRGTLIIKDVIRHFFNEQNHLELVNKVAEFNFYKNINKNVSSSLQHHPHIDIDYNVVIYLDKVSSGGTALYELPNIPNNEHKNLLYNVDNIDKKIIKAVPNRLVIFDGSKMHGGYIEDHNKYVDDWRINQIMFFKRYEQKN